MFALALSLGMTGTVVALLLGPAIATAGALALLEHRPMGTDLVVLWVMLASAVLMTAAVLVSIAVWAFGGFTFGSPSAILALLGAYAVLVYVVLWPAVVRGSQVESWPAGIELAAFEVCTTQPSGPNARGRLTVEIVNRSGHVLREAAFTVAGSRDPLAFDNLLDPPHRIDEADLPPGERRRIVADDLDLAALTRPSWTRRDGPRAIPSAELLWDRARFTGLPKPALTERPPSTTAQVVACPPR